MSNGGENMKNRHHYRRHNYHPPRRNRVKGWVIGIGIILGAITALELTHPSPSLSGASGAGIYEVVSVYKGAVQVRDKETGRIIHIKDQKLVRMALDGAIKAGDLIKVTR